MPDRRFVVCVALVGVVVTEAVAGEPFRVEYKHVVRNRSARTLTDVRVWLPVPPQTPYQRIVTYQVELDGRTYPVQRESDAFGQTLMCVTIPQLGPRHAVELGFSCDCIITQPPRIELDPDISGTVDEIPPELLALYTREEGGIYDLNSREIQDLALRFRKAYPNLVGRTLAIHDFVAGRIDYERDGGWDSAAKVLKRGKGSCSEFTYLFCAICRAAGLPTRMVGATECLGSLPFTDRVWHRWAEAYLPPYGWVPFDPTRDRGKPPRRRHVGTFPSNVLILTQRGGGPPLGQSYLGENSHGAEVESLRCTIWRPGERPAVAAAAPVELWAEQASRSADADEAAAVASEQPPAPLEKSAAPAEPASVTH